MKKPKELSALEIANKIRAGDNFWVNTERERKHALNYSRYVSAGVVTKAENGKFLIIIPTAIAK